MQKSLMSYQEIAQTLDTTISTIRSKLFRARKMLAQTVGQQQKATIIPHQTVLAASG